MEPIVVILIFAAGFLIGTILSTAGAAVKNAQAQVQAEAAFRQGWWTGIQEIKSIHTGDVGQAPVPQPPLAYKGKKGVN